MLRGGDLAAGEIAARFDMTAPTVSHHLSVLKDAGLVQAERNGRSVVYSIDTTVVQDFLGEMMRFFGKGGEQ
jgi:DNA-binding transcriptional ArsR family regulator